MGVDAVVWDIGHVLVQWSIRGLYEKLIDDPAELDWFLEHVVTLPWHFRHDAGEPLADLIAEKVAEYPDHRALIEAYGPRWLETIPGLIPGTPALVEALAAKGVPQFAITNFGADTFAMFRPAFPVLDPMIEIVVSGIERLAKPDPAIFRLAAQRFGHAPERMLFIDDNAANIASARALGWQVHHFTRGAEALAADLGALGLI
ncbi:HAD family phosphatase [Novosphingobium sp. PASSN1]|uniref:HAD family hydrolase n=1 Tax=Novosphingobium sp. PASSN1 TaxID=2015561 RepID=UPI000BD8F7E8|nr:HAD family phosphatase [Novosphingobium sp. PASSN1]OYU36455.1 MAG: hydrolase [Novosphingobium sp. PASSN1]